MKKILILIPLGILLVNCSQSRKLSITNTIKSIKIGTQEWTIENLNVETFNNGDTILHALTANEWKDACQNRIPAWCYYDNDVTNKTVYGRLYNYYALIDSRGIAPNGFRLPSDNDWKILESYLGIDTTELNQLGLGGRGRDVSAASRLADSSVFWAEGNLSKSSDFGEDGLKIRPGGFRNVYGEFFSQTEFVGFWTKTEFENEIFCRVFGFHSSGIIRYHYPKDYGLYVRCIKK